VRIMYLIDGIQVTRHIWERRQIWGGGTSARTSRLSRFDNSKSGG